ncbi:uncharacterized protein LOC108598592 [Drosophila busckii]|uniref:uncharacterized protein LOC108598592 n=1 Tax=Drosophila busckii TaxID=30019 RepID=UPI001432ABA2|nr:uncharacterized protein LOC108598592 [Drosophila busckii]
MSKTLLLSFTLSALLGIALSQMCGNCMENGVACVNQTHFKVCVNQATLPGNALYCGDGKVCTSLMGAFCFEGGSDVETVCDEQQDCPSCSAKSMFVCTSRTTFQMCDGTKMQKEISTCPAGLFCTTNAEEICVKECKLPNGKPDCTKDAP